MNQKKLSIIMFLANLTESEILHKEIKGPHNCLVILNIQKRNTGSILRSPGPGRKDKIDDEKYKMIIEMLKEVNTLSAFYIHKKLIDNGVSVGNKN